MKADEINRLIQEHNLKSPDGEKFEEVKDFNLMFTTNVGPVQDENSMTYLRPETAQMIFADFNRRLICRPVLALIRIRLISPG